MFPLKIVDTAANDSYLYIGRGVIWFCWCRKFVTRRILRVVLYPLTDIVSGSMSLPNKKGNFVIHAFKSSPARDPDMVIVAFDNFRFLLF